MVRHVTSFNHGEGTVNDGWKSTGTFLKLMGLLPYLKGIGVDTLVLLPITEIGDVGRKGTLGSPYAAKHPFRLDPHLAESNIDMSVDDQARVLVETCHLLGMKVILEVVLRTASIDSDLVHGHPEWFYWVDEKQIGSMDSFRSPVFTPDALAEMHSMIESSVYVDLPAPAEKYQQLFDHMPLRVERDERGWKGIGARGKVLRIPGAFADWPPDDPQPAWSDVTYLRMHDHPSFRYMAYNTIRMFERELDQPSYRQTSLWNTIAGIIPHYIRMFGIDGAMIDMGHALPSELRSRIITESRTVKPNFILLEENFLLEASSRTAGYDAVVGYLPFDAHDAKKLTSFVERVSRGDIPIRFFAAPESHNTQRAASRMSPRAGIALLLFLRFLPHGLSILHAGLELNDDKPVNTGLGFTQEMMDAYPPEKLALFSDSPLPWQEGIDTALWIQEKVKKYAAFNVLRQLSDIDSIESLDVDDIEVVAFLRRLPGSRCGILVVVNISSVSRTVRLPLSRVPSLQFTSVLPGVSLQRDDVTIDIGGADVLVIPTLHRPTDRCPTSRDSRSAEPDFKS